MGNRMPKSTIDPSERKLVPLVVRVDEGVREALDAWAADTERSLAAVVRLALRDGVPKKYLR